MTVSRRVGRAVTRNLVRRRIREIFRRWKQRERLPAVDLVFHAKPAAALAGFRDLRRELEGQLRRLCRETA